MFTATFITPFLLLKLHHSLHGFNSSLGLNLSTFKQHYRTVGEVHDVSLRTENSLINNLTIGCCKENGKSPQPVLCWSSIADVLCNPQEAIFQLCAVWARSFMEQCVCFGAMLLMTDGG